MAKLLKSAGQAVKALVAIPSEEAGSEASETISIDQQKQDFTAATSQYFALVSSVDIGLRQQIRALEEAKIISSEAATRESQSSAETSAAASAGAPVVGGFPTGASRSALAGAGLGSLDIGWLNSRNDNVEEEMEAELWKKASSFLASLRERKPSA